MEILSDTSPEILRLQAELLSRLTDEQRLMKALNHSQFVRDLREVGLRRRILISVKRSGDCCSSR